MTKVVDIVGIEGLIIQLLNNRLLVAIEKDEHVYPIIDRAIDSETTIDDYISAVGIRQEILVRGKNGEPLMSGGSA